MQKSAMILTTYKLEYDEKEVDVCEIAFWTNLFPWSTSWLEHEVW